MVADLSVQGKRLTLALQDNLIHISAGIVVVDDHLDFGETEDVHQFQAGVEVSLLQELHTYTHIIFLYSSLRVEFAVLARQILQHGDGVLGSRTGVVVLVIGEVEQVVALYHCVVDGPHAVAV